MDDTRRKEVIKQVIGPDGVVASVIKDGLKSIASRPKVVLNRKKELGMMVALVTTTSVIWNSLPIIKERIGINRQAVTDWVQQKAPVPAGLEWVRQPVVHQQYRREEPADREWVIHPHEEAIVFWLVVFLFIFWLR